MAITQKWRMKDDETYDSTTDFRLRSAVSANLDLGFSYEYTPEDKRLSISFLRYF